MNLNNKIRIAKMGYIFVSILFCIFGCVLIIKPDISAMLLCKSIGIIMIIFGLVKIIGYFSKDTYRLAFQYDLACGILLILLGIILIIHTEQMLSVFSLVFGLYILADALLKIQMAIDSKNFGISRWWSILITAILTGAFGFLLIFQHSMGLRTLMTIFGLSLITEGLLNLVTIFTAVKIIRGRINKFIEA